MGIVSIRMDDQLKDAIAEAAKQQNVSFSKLIKTRMEIYLKRRKHV